MNQEIIEQLIEKIKSCKDEDMLDFVLKLLIECGY